MKIRLIKKLASNKNQRESRWITDHREKKKKIWKIYRVSIIPLLL